MESLKKLDCFICNKDIEEFYNSSSKMIMINHQLMDKIVRQSFGIKALGPGRIVILNSTVGVSLGRRFFLFVILFYPIVSCSRSYELMRPFVYPVPQKYPGGYSQDRGGSRHGSQAGQVVLVLHPDRSRFQGGYVSHQLFW